MRKELLYNPFLLTERIGEEFARRKRLRRLKGTSAYNLNESQITSLEFLEIAKNNYPVKVIYDIGGNIGTWSQLAKAIFPNAIIHAFEPIKKFQDHFLTNTKEFGKSVTLHKTGLGSKNGTASINVGGDASSFLEIGSLLTSFFPTVKKTGEEIVNISMLDSYVQQTNLAFPDVMKLDVEGFELEVLKSAKECMKKCKYIILEISFEERHIGQPLFPDVVYFLAQHNFHICSFPAFMHLAQKIYWTDILFENRSIK